MKSERVELVPIERDSVRWQNLAAAIAMNFCPAIYFEKLIKRGYPHGKAE